MLLGFWRMLYCTIIFSNILLQGHLYIIDINDTIMAKNDIDPQKTREVVLGQMVAQNIYLTSGCSVENHIKSTIKDKSKQRVAYETLIDYVKKLIDQNFMTIDQLDQLNLLKSRYSSALDVCDKNSNGVFPSLFRLIEHIEAHDPSPRILFQSFGAEIPDVLNFLQERSGNLLKKWSIDHEIGLFEEDGMLFWKGLCFNTDRYGELNPFVNDKLFPPFSIKAWRNNYTAWRHQGLQVGKLIFFDDREKDVRQKTFFFDDNAAICATIMIGGQYFSLASNNNMVDGLDGVYIVNVDTAQALLDKDYFVKIVSK